MWKVILLIILVTIICCYFLIPQTQMNLLGLAQLYDVGGSVCGGNEGNKFKLTDSWQVLIDNSHKYYDLIQIQERFIKYDINWSQVFYELQTEVNESGVEYAGLIHLDDNNRAFIVNKFRGKEGPPNNMYVAAIPQKMVNKIRQQPAAILFHTHPSNGCPLPSIPDLVLSYHDSIVSGRLFLEAVISKSGIILYGVKASQFLKDFRNPDKSLLIPRKELDLFNSIVALRSYAGYSENDMAYLLDQFGMWYVKFDINGGATMDYGLFTWLQNNVIKKEKNINLYRKH